MWGKKLLKVAEEGDLGGVNAAIEAGASVEAQAQVGGMTPSFNLASLTSLLPGHASHARCPPLTQFGFTPLRIACLGGHAAVVDALIHKHGANVEAVDKVRPGGVGGWMGG